MSDAAVIPAEKYRQLLVDQRLLDCLLAAGVGNWEGYEEALEQFKEGEIE